MPSLLQSPTPQSAIKMFDIRALGAIKGKIIVKDESPEEDYREAISRWNQVFVKEAVSQHVMTNERSDEWLN